MAITPAHFKKFIAGTTDAVPCTFDPTDGNAIEWILNTPCVRRDAIELSGFVPGSFSLGLDGGFMSSKLCIAGSAVPPITVTTDGVTLAKGGASFTARIPVWSSLAAGDWTGSMVYSLYITSDTAAAARDIFVTMSFGLGSFGSVLWTPTAGTPGACSTELRATLTVYDTGRVTVT
jgi:hypothetical protein